MPRPRRNSTASSHSASTTGEPSSTNDASAQEMGSMYDYLAKIILLGPSGSGKTCLLHRFVKNEWRVLCSQTIGVEFASRIVKLGGPVGNYGGGYNSYGGGGGRRTRIKLQLWDTAGTERFRSVSRSYYRGAAGAILVYDVSDREGLAKLQTFLEDVRALASPQVTVALAGNKADLGDDGLGDYGSPNPNEGDEDDDEEEDLMDLSSSNHASLKSQSTLRQARNIGLGAQQRATPRSATTARAVSASSAAAWANRNRIPVSMDVSALSGENVEEVFHKLAATILTKIELGEIDPSDPMSGIQYGDADYLRFGEDGGSMRSGITNDAGMDEGGTLRRRRGKRKRGLVGLENMFGGGGGGGGGIGNARSKRCC